MPPRVCQPLHIVGEVWVWNCRDSKVVVPRPKGTSAEPLGLFKEKRGGFLDPPLDSLSQIFWDRSRAVETRYVCHVDLFHDSFFLRWPFLHWNNMQEDWENPQVNV